MRCMYVGVSSMFRRPFRVLAKVGWCPSELLRGSTSSVELVVSLPLPSFDFTHQKESGEHCYIQ